MQPACSAADTSLFLDVTGNVSLCCPGDVLGSLKNQTLESILDGELFNDVKNELNSGSLPPKFCDTCIKTDQQSPGSAYLHHLNTRYPSTGNRQVQHIDLRWDNTCNLMCRYCNANSSSQWASFLKIDTPKAREYSNDVLSYVKNNRDTITGISLLGGEPLLQKQNLKLLDIIAPDTNIDIVTNLSIPLESNAIFNRLLEFDVRWNISFENTGSRFEFVRDGAKWEVFSKNIATLRRNINRPITCLATYNVLAVGDMDNLYKFCNDNGMLVTWQVFQPGITHLQNSLIPHGHCEKFNQMAIDEIDAVVQKWSDDIKLTSVPDFLQGMKSTLESIKSTRARTLHFIKWLGSLKTNKYQELWPDQYSVILETFNQKSN